MRHFKNKFFLIALTVALCLTVFSVVLSASGHAWFLKDALNVASIPLRSAFNWCADGVQGFINYFTEFDRIAAENEELRKENEELKNLQSDIEVLKAENAWLRDFLDVKNQDLEFSFTDATVIGYNAGSSHDTVTLNRGSINGIEKGMVVITGQGLVGRIEEVGLSTCEVVCIIDVSSSIGALVERSAMIGIVDGYYEGNCRFHYTTGFLDSSDISVGDTVISSGKGSIYPYGLKIGTVTEIQLDDASRSIIATIKPSVDFENLDRVMIITSFTVK